MNASLSSRLNPINPKSAAQAGSLLWKSGSLETTSSPLSSCSSEECSHFSKGGLGTAQKGQQQQTKLDFDSNKSTPPSSRWWMETATSLANPAELDWSRI